MTAFARTEIKNENHTIICELKSINHRFLEFSFYLSDILRPLEGVFREAIRPTIKRGKIDCFIRYQATDSSENIGLKVNIERARTLSIAAEQILTFIKDPASIQVTDIMRFPGVLENADADLNTIKPNVLAALEEALKELIAARAREGAALSKLFLERMILLEAQVKKISVRMPSIIEEQQQRLLKRFQEVKLELDPARLEQEMLLFAQKIDISEELDRAQTHINEVRRIIKEGGSVGRRLDFLMQELNREANTIGSKSVDTITNLAAVEMKVLIEQVREQVQNIE